MARYEKGRDDTGRIKVRVIDFEVEGSNATLQASLRDFAAALRGAGGARPLSATPARPMLPTNGDAPDGQAEPAAEVEFAEVDATGDTEEPVAEPRRTRVNGQRRYTKPNVIDLDLTSGDMPLKTYIEQKGEPKGHADRYLVIATWLKEFRQTEAVTQDHMYTCYKHMDWNTPRDASEPLRFLKKNDSMYKGTERGSYIINHIGENAVRQMGKN